MLIRPAKTKHTHPKTSKHKHLSQNQIQTSTQQTNLHKHIRFNKYIHT